MILICYDGSQDARTAIERASGLFRGQPAVVLSVWEDFSNVLLRTGAALGGAAIEFEEIDQASEASARERAEEGARLARETGFDAQPRVAVRGVTIWETILEQAVDVQASAVVLGSRGLTGVKSLLLGAGRQARPGTGFGPSVVLTERAVDLDLLVMGSRAYGPLQHVPLGSVSHEVLLCCGSPVLVVPRGAVAGAGQHERVALPAPS
jgi:nucleotide-binding universal stress UspA family protein